MEKTISQERVRYAAAMASDQAEIERLKRRDVVISEAMSRLTDDSDEECVSPKWSSCHPHSPSRIRALGLAVSPGQPRASKKNISQREDVTNNDNSGINIVENPSQPSPQPKYVNTTLDVQKHIDAALKERAQRKNLCDHEQHHLKSPELQQHPARLENEVVVDESRPTSVVPGRSTYNSKRLNHKPTPKPIKR